MKRKTIVVKAALAQKRVLGETASRKISFFKQYASGICVSQTVDLSRKNASIYDECASEAPQQYTGRENDQTGLYYYRARYYSPGMMRFISDDPIGLAGGINMTSYVGGNPLSFIDPLGLDRQGLPTATITVTQFADKSGQPYGAGITVSGDAGNGVFPGNSFPNPENGSPGIVDGTYTGRYGDTAHKGGEGVVLNGNGKIPTLGPNPNQPGSPSLADYIHLHCGGENTRGSAGCITAQKSQCKRLMDLLRKYHPTSIIIVTRVKDQ